MTKWQMAYSLLDHPDLGDRCPSAMMAEMLSLRFETTAPDSLFLALFLHRLPASIRDHLAAANHTTATEMATHADILWDARNTASVSAVSESLAAVSVRSASALFEYLFMPFGLTNAAQSFQRLMDKLFRHLPFVFTYLDDHLISSRTLEEHLLHLQQFFQVLQENGLTINPAKCVFAVSSLKFLGHMVDEAGVTPLPKHIAAVQDCPPPTDIKQLQRFLGLINFYRRFLPAVVRHKLSGSRQQYSLSPKRLRRVSFA